MHLISQRKLAYNEEENACIKVLIGCGAFQSDFTH